jgi:hypothetical protein
MPIWASGDLISYTQSIWGDPATNAAGLLITNFAGVYPTGLEVGLSGSAGFSMLFTLGSAVVAYLPAIEATGTLTTDLLNPSESPSGIFGGEVTALALNIDFADAGLTLGTSAIPFGDLTLCNMATIGPGLSLFDGLTARQVLADANTVLGGGTTFYGVDEWLFAANSLNHSFVGGAVDQFAQDHLVYGPCP